MPQTIITIDDLDHFKEELIQALKKIIIEQPDTDHQKKKWLKNKEVEKYLGLSPSKLHLLRVSGKLPHIKMGRTIYYDLEDVNQMMHNAKR